MMMMTPSSKRLVEEANLAFSCGGMSQFDMTCTLLAVYKQRNFLHKISAPSPSIYSMSMTLYGPLFN